MTPTLPGAASGSLPTLLAAVLGAGAGLGLLLLALGLRGTTTRARGAEVADPPGSRLAGGARAPGRPGDPRQWRRIAVAAAGGLLVLLVTRWVAAAVGVAALVALFDRVFGGTRRARQATSRLDALASWTESLRDLVATGVALPEALPASVTSAAPALHPHLQRLADRIEGREPVDAALRALGDDLDDGGADLVVAALLLNVRAQGRALEAVLTALAVSLRAQLRVRRTIEAERRSTRRAVQIVVAVTVATAVGLSVANPTYVQPYQTLTGQAVLAVVVAVFAAGFSWLARLSALPAPPRLLPAVSAAASPAGGGRR